MMGRSTLLLLTAVCAGCGTTRQTDSVRAGTEMLLVSQAVDEDRSLSLDIELVATAIRNGEFDSETEKI